MGLKDLTPHLPPPSHGVAAAGLPGGHSSPRRPPTRPPALILHWECGAPTLPLTPWGTVVCPGCSCAVVAAGVAPKDVSTWSL